MARSKKGGDTPSRSLISQAEKKQSSTNAKKLPTNTAFAIRSETLDNENKDNERKLFYQKVKNELSVFTEKALVKFPLQTKLNTIKETLLDIENVTSCNAKHELKRKWTITDNVLCHKNTGLPISVWERVYDIIATVDSDNKFRLSKSALFYAVKNVSANITNSLVNFYCDHVSKKRQKDSKPKRKRDETKAVESEKIKKAKSEEDFAREVKSWTAASLVQNEIPPPLTRKECSNLGTGVTSDSAETVGNEPSFRSDKVQPDETVGKQPSISSNEQEPQTNTDKVTVSAENDSEVSESKVDLTDRVKLKKVVSLIRNTKDDQDGGKHFQCEHGIHNRGHYCWMNAFVMILFHQIPKNMVAALSNFSVRGDHSYQNIFEEFTANAYYVINIMCKNSVENCLTFNGNAVFHATSDKLVNIFARQYNNNIDKSCSTYTEERRKEKYLKKDQCQDIIEMMSGLLSLCNGLVPYEESFCIPVYNLTYFEKGKTQEVEDSDSLFPFFGMDSANYDGWNFHFEKNTKRILRSLKMRKEWKNGRWNKNPEVFAEAVKFEQKQFKHVLSPSDFRSIFFGITDVAESFVPHPVLTELKKKQTKDTDETKRTGIVYERMVSIIKFSEVLVFSLNQTGSGERYFGDENVENKDYLSFQMPYDLDITKLDEKIDIPNKCKNPTETETYQTCGLMLRTVDTEDINYGHYVCIVRQQHNKKWRYFDDDLENSELTDESEWEREMGKRLLVAVFMKRQTKQHVNSGNKGN